nr:MAG TPA: hypothetical protein [Caudoviricetes sp.]
MKRPTPREGHHIVLRDNILFQPVKRSCSAQKLNSYSPANAGRLPYY